MLSLVFLTALVSTTLCKTCDENDSIDITDGVHMPDGVINYKGLSYRTYEYFSDGNKTRGCVCEKKTCASKCCPQGYGYYRTKKTCVELSGQAPFNPPVLDEYYKREDVNATVHFHFIAGKPNCSSKERRVAISSMKKRYHLTIVSIFVHVHVFKYRRQS